MKHYIKVGRGYYKPKEIGLGSNAQSPDFYVDIFTQDKPNDDSNRRTLCSLSIAVDPIRGAWLKITNERGQERRVLLETLS